MNLLGNRLVDGSLAMGGTGLLTNITTGATVDGDVSNAATIAVTALLNGGPDTNDNLRAALYVTNLLMGADSFLIISSNVTVYFLTSNDWSAANFTLLGGPVLGNQGHLHQFVVGEVLSIPEPGVLLLWLSGLATVIAARRRARDR